MQDVGNSGQVKTLQSYLKLAEKCVELVQKKRALKFNKEQCDYLADKLEVVVKSASLFLTPPCAKHQTSCSSADTERRVQIIKLLLAMAKQIESFVQGCCNEAWIQAAMKLTYVSEYVASLGFNLELCTVAFSKECGAAGSRTLDQVEVEDIYRAELDIVEKKAFVDTEALRSKLELEQKSSRGKKKGLAAYLLEKLSTIRRDPLDSFTSGSSLSSGVIDGGYLQNFCNLIKLEISTQLGRGASATVYKVMWLGTPVAKNRSLEKRIQVSCGKLKS